MDVKDKFELIGGEIMEHNTYAMKLENEFRRICPSARLPAGLFRSAPMDALETALQYLVADGLLSAQDMKIWLAQFDFGKETLREYLQKPYAKETIEELLSQLKAISKDANK